MILESPQDNILQEDLEVIASSDLDFKLFRDKNILITGATGLVGSQLVKALSACNRIHNLNLHILALIRNEKKAEEIYGTLSKRGEIQFVKADITKPIHIDEKIDYVIHGAAVTISKTMVEKPVETINTAIDGIKNLLELATEKKVDSMVFLSSMEMYGSFSEDGRVIEETDLGYVDPLAVRSNYPESKRMSENMCIAYKTEYDLPVKIARLSQTFGAGILPGENRIFAQFARSVINGKDIVLHTKGQSEGNYCYTRDTILGILTILLKGKNGEAYNVCNEETHIKIADMAKLVVEKIAKDQIALLFDIPDNNVFGYAQDTKMQLSSAKLRKLGWKPTIGLTEAYTRLIASMKVSGLV